LTKQSTISNFIYWNWK